MKIGVFGRGRMAAAILAACGSDVEVAWSLGREDVPAGPVDVAIDVAHGDGVEAHLAWAVERARRSPSAPRAGRCRTSSPEWAIAPVCCWRPTSR